MRCENGRRPGGGSFLSCFTLNPVAFFRGVVYDSRDMLSGLQVVATPLDGR